MRAHRIDPVGLGDDASWESGSSSLLRRPVCLSSRRPSAFCANANPAIRPREVSTLSKRRRKIPQQQRQQQKKGPYTGCVFCSHNESVNHLMCCGQIYLGCGSPSPWGSTRLRPPLCCYNLGFLQEKLCSQYSLCGNCHYTTVELW